MGPIIFPQDKQIQIHLNVKLNRTKPYQTISDKCDKKIRAPEFGSQFESGESKIYLNIPTRESILGFQR